MGTYGDGEDRPAVLSEFMSLCCVLHASILAWRIVPMFFYPLSEYICLSA